jgi:PAS domain S-box-containing protein
MRIGQTAWVSKLRLIWNILTSPQTTNQDEARSEYMTRSILVGLVLVAAIFLPTFFILWYRKVFTIAVPVAAVLFTTVFIAGWLLCLRGKWQLARYLPVASFLAAGIVDACLHGPRLHNALAFTMMILLTSILHGSRTQWLALVLSLLATLIAHYTMVGATTSWLELTAQRYHLTIICVFLLAFTLLQHFFRTRYQRALEHSRDLAFKLEDELADRRRVEEDLRESEAKYRAILEGVQDGYYEVDIEGRFLFVNDAVCRFLGYSRHQLIGMAYTRYMDEQNAEAVLELFGHVASSGEPLSGTELEVTRSDGSRCSVETSVSLIVSAAGHPVGFRGVARDITERKWANKVEQVLHSISEAVTSARDLTGLLTAVRSLLSTVIDTTNFYVALYNADTEIYSFPYFIDQVDGNEPIKMKAVHGSLTDYVRRTGKSLLLDKTARADLAKRQGIERGIGTKAAIWLGVPLVTDRGTIGVVVVQSYDNPNLYTKKDLELLNRAAGHISVAVERKQAESRHLELEAQVRQAQKMESLGVLAGGIAHDFNNLLQVMAGVPHLLQSHCDNPSQVSTIAGELEQLVKLGGQQASKLLLFSRKEPASLQPHDLNVVVAESVGFLRRLIRENISLEMEMAEQPLPVHADRGQLEQVLMNLAVNATDAMPLGGELIIRTGGHEDKKVWFEVEDSGGGVSEEIAERIFDPFFTTKDPAEGTGLGLSVVHGIIRQHGGQVSLRNRTGKGAIFRVVLNRAEEIPAEPAVEPEPDRREPAISDANILLVEDDEDVRESLTVLIKMLGYQVTAASSGEAAIELASRERFNLMITDYLLPGISGLELASVLKERPHSPEVILLTGYAEDEALQQVVSEGVINLLRKPCSTSTLSEAIKHGLGSATRSSEPAQ